MHVVLLWTLAASFSLLHARFSNSNYIVYLVVGAIQMLTVFGGVLVFQFRLFFPWILGYFHWVGPFSVSQPCWLAINWPYLFSLYCFLSNCNNGFVKWYKFVEKTSPLAEQCQFQLCSMIEEVWSDSYSRLGLWPFCLFNIQYHWVPSFFIEMVWAGWICTIIPL